MSEDMVHLSELTPHFVKIPLEIPKCGVETQKIEKECFDHESEIPKSERQ